MPSVGGCSPVPGSMPTSPRPRQKKCRRHEGVGAIFSPMRVMRPHEEPTVTDVSPAEAVFFAALAKVDPAERAAYLNEACGADVELRRQVDRLLAAHPQVGSFLQDDAAVHPSPLGGVGPAMRDGVTVDL